MEVKNVMALSHLYKVYKLYIETSQPHTWNLGLEMSLSFLVPKPFWQIERQK